MTTRPLTVAAAERTLAAIPELIGCQPTESLVIVPLRDGGAYGGARMDLPGDNPAHLESAATGAAGLLSSLPATRQCVLVVCSDTAPESHRALMDEIRKRMDHCGITVREALWMTSRRWGSYLSGGNRSLRAVRARSNKRASFGGGGHPTGDQHAGARLPTVDTSLARLVSGAVDVLLAALDRDAVASPQQAAQVILAHARNFPNTVPEFFEEVLRTPPRDLDPVALAATGLLLSLPCMRDVALIQWSADLAKGHATLAENLAYLDGDTSGLGGEMRLAGQGARPHRERMHRALDLVTTVAACLPDEVGASALASAAWLSWALGRSTHAGIHAEAALLAFPGHSLANLVLTMANATRLPAWLFRQPDEVSYPELSVAS